MCGNWFLGSPFGGMMSGYGRGGYLLPFLLGLALIILVVIFITTLVRKNPSSKVDSSANHAVQILDERYASGEISQEEYKLMKKEIQQ